LRRAGVEYVIMSCGGSRESLRRFAHEIMPAFADAPAQVWAGFQPTSYKQMRASRPIVMIPEQPLRRFKHCH
jgi:hypothetical protein